MRGALAKVTRDDVNRVLRQHLRTNRVVIVAVTNNGEDLKKSLASDAPSAMTYNSPKPEALTEVDKAVEKWPLNLSEADIKVVPSTQVFD
jgi:hypothetical protein